MDVETAYARVPAAARAHTPQGAQAFAEFYVDQINRAWTLPDPGMLAGYGSAACKSCGAYEGTARSLRQDGQRYSSAPVAKVAAAWLPGATGARVETDVVAHKNAVDIVNSSGGLVKTTDSVPLTLRFEVRWTKAARWEIATIKLVKAA